MCSMTTTICVVTVLNKEHSGNLRKVMKHEPELGCSYSEANGAANQEKMLTKQTQHDEVGSKV